MGIYQIISSPEENLIINFIDFINKIYQLSDAVKSDIFNYLPVAQLVEHRTFNPGVTGSNPVRQTSKKSQTMKGKR